MRLFDHAAATPMRPSVRRALADAEPLANPASTHREGQRALAVLEDARERLAAAIGAHPTEVIFTSGGTESINLAVKGAWWAAADGRDPAAIGPIVVPVAEHHATLDAVEWLERQGAAVRWIGVDAHAVTDADAFAAALAGGPTASGATASGATASGAIASIATMLVASNEVGSLQPVAAVADAAARAGVPLHLDAVGAFGHLPLRFAETGASLMSVASHKLGGPHGVGALVVRRDAKLQALHHGGGQQRGLRSGTQDALGASLFAFAAEEALAELEQESARLRELTDRILAAVAALPGVQLLATRERLPHIAHLVVEGAQGESLQFLLDEAGFAVSNGSACSAGVARESHVVRACGLEGVAPLRLSLGRTTTAADVDALLAALPTAIARARTL
ncbi:aminotransferase class V-fold PLP-dependent enzyme [Agrococcus sp. ARC_14]|uniref:cysteine desulfurase family protein n=1 Tax=Agrococcus sp. ARC_14 TaxID=2919927 RepID=UPI001F0659D1|nr:aminotransferase class V-fold PLP-dependent enzyme [Agrococcus sp. ARC_14]MCH1882785.1 aminotransferase class V-fold PLP-dependent enzyme [Agrococcus sp. ARC_14]